MNSLIERIISSNHPQTLHEQRGQWFPIQISPSAYGGEIINVGVCFVDQNGMVHSRISNDFSRLKCFYDDDLNLDDIELSTTLLHEAINSSPYSAVKELRFGHQLRFGSASFAQGSTPTTILNSLFDKAVTIGRPRKSEINHRFRPTSESVAKHQVLKFLHDKYAMTAQLLLGNGRVVKFPGEGQDPAKRLTVDLRQEGKRAGMIATAMVSDVDKVELRMLRAWNNLQVLHDAVREEDRALFLLRPDESSGLPEKTLAKHDDILSEMDWKMRSEGITFRYEFSPETLADDIAEWCGQKAS